MWVYKITNIQNGKVYIGQTIRPVQQRFRRHMNDAFNGLDTHFARAIRKYGKENFIVEKIDEAKTQEELTEKEQYWIRYYDSINNGYNETDAKEKCGGNTYQSKSKEDLEKIKAKIRVTKIGEQNPMARKIKMIDITTNEVQYFNTVISCAKSLGIKGGKTSITQRLNGHVKSPFRKKYVFEYCDK